MENLKMIQAYSFKSKTLDGRPAKIYVATYDNGAIGITKFFIDYIDRSAHFELVRKINSVFLYRERVAFKASSLITIVQQLGTLIKSGKLTIN